MPGSLDSTTSSTRSRPSCAGSGASSSRSAAAPTARSSPPSPSRTLGARRPRRDRGVAVAGRRRGGRLPGAGRRVGPALDAGRHRRDGARRLPDQRQRSLLPLQGRADGRRRPDRRGRGRHRGARRQPRRPRRPSPGPARRRPSAAPRSRWSLPGSPRPTCAPRRGRSGLRTWDKPAAACLASRVPYGTEVTSALLSQVDRAEAALQAARASPAARAPLRRHGAHRGAARPTGRRASPARGRVVAAVEGAGYRYVTLDLEGFRSGNLNARARPDDLGSVAHEAVDDDQLRRRVQGGRPAGRRAGEGRPRSGVGRRGLQLRRHQPGRLPRGQDRAGRDRHRASSTCTRARPR